MFVVWGRLHSLSVCICVCVFIGTNIGIVTAVRLYCIVFVCIVFYNTTIVGIPVFYNTVMLTHITHNTKGALWNLKTIFPPYIPK